MSFKNYYDSPYGRSRDPGRNTIQISTTDRPTTVTAKYINTPSYKSSSIPILCTDRSATREESHPPSISNRYSSYNKTEKPGFKYEKKEYSKLTLPKVSSNRNRDVSPLSTSSKYSLNRSSGHLSPERRTTKNYKERSRDNSPMDRERDIPNKTDKSSSYNSLTSYKLYSRTPNYSRPNIRPEVKPEITVNRYAIANRLSSNYLRSPLVKRTSVSPVNNSEADKSLGFAEATKRLASADQEIAGNAQEDNRSPKENEIKNSSENCENNLETITLVTRHTSPTPPGSSVYVRTRRADMAKTIEKNITRTKERPEMIDKEVQSDRLDESTRSSRFGSTSRASSSNWSLYTPSVNSYTGYAGRYSTQYSNLRESLSGHIYNERSSRSRSTEPQPSENLNQNSYNENKSSEASHNGPIDFNQELIVDEQNKDDDKSEIIINVNLRLKKAKSPFATAAAEIGSSEITIANSQLPPQPPKQEGNLKPKKLKIRKSSTDSLSDSSSKKKSLKKRSKSTSSSESEQGDIGERRKDCSISPPKTLLKNSSSNNIPKGRSKLKQYKSRESSSPDSSITLSTQSSMSDDDTVSKCNTNNISRTSADETSISVDRSLKQSQKNETGTEDAKSFLIRALAPVTNLFKTRQQENDNYLTENSTSESTSKDISNFITESEKSSKSKSNTDNIIASNDDNLVKLKAIRHIESGEKAWWLDSDSEKQHISQSLSPKSLSDKEICKNTKNVNSVEKASWLSENDSTKNRKLEIEVNSASNSSKPLRQCKMTGDEEKPWWLDSNANIPEGIERLSPPRKTSADSEKNEKLNFFKIRHIDSGEQKDWWLSNADNSSNSPRVDVQNTLSNSSSDHKNFPLRRIHHVDSGERPWWLSSDKNIPEGIEKLPTPPPQQDTDSSDAEDPVYKPSLQVPLFSLNLADDEPLGDRRSPEGLETPERNENFQRRSSLFDNNLEFKIPSSVNYQYQQKTTDKYISRYTDIDDILGMSGQIYSPFMDSILARRTGQILYEDGECEEIDPTQVRIHDSTPQRPIIRKLHDRSDIIDCRDEDQLDDATLQVFKDGEYGPYLDLESTPGEQDEELDGLQDSRKNAIVLRTQLSVRVHAIIERLLHSQGRELRRALFTLKQILQSDKDLVHEFVANKGLDCLMEVGSMTDHNILEYILRALGQILLYVDGMHGVMAHKRCVQWLYSLISSMFRHVVKTALKLLLVFVEYTEKNCLLLIDAILTVDGLNGNQPWHNIMKILQDFDASDTELLIYATTLINRCLNNIPDRDTYYDQVDALQDQGIDDIIQLYMSKQGTDLDLLRQLQIFEAVLHYEDGDDTGMALKQLDESVVTSVRRRSLNLNTSEKRKSKKQQIKEKGNQRYTTGLKQRIQNGTLGHSVSAVDALVVMRQKQLESTPETKDDKGILLNKEHSIKDLAQRLTSPVSPTTEEKLLRVGDMAGIVSKAKEELARSQTKEISKSPSVEKTKVHEIKISENDLHWEEIKKMCINREFHLCDLDFSDLRNDSDEDLASPTTAVEGAPPPPPPAMFSTAMGPPPPPNSFPPASKTNVPPPFKAKLSSELSNDSDSSTIKKNKKTVKLFWREIQENPVPMATQLKVEGLIWDDLPQVDVDTKMLEHLFESRTNDLIIKEKLMEPKRNIILDAKRSNAINIAMKKLPTPQTIKAAIMKMDATVIGREGIEKLLTMLPTEDEKVKIQEAQYANPDLPLGSAEQFLLTLASINELPSRLKLWVFKLDFDNLEKEIAEPLMDLKNGVELLKINKTFKVILSALRSVGSFLNGNPVRGFRLEYLSKVTEVKDTVHKHPLLHHICEMIIEKFPDSTDFFSEVGPVIRASKVDFDVLNTNLSKLESDCKASWDHMKKVTKHDSSQIFKTKINEFLTDAAERIILLTFIKKRVMCRYNKFLSYLGIPSTDITKTKPSEFLKVIAEFALEYRTSRERVLQQLEKKANHRERNKTRGKMIIDMANYANKNGDHSPDSALMNLLKTDSYSLIEGRRKAQPVRNKLLVNGDLSADEEILESLVRSATTKRQPITRERRRNRLSDRQNLNRTLDRN